MPFDRDQLLRLATFWLRPDFVLRVLARFQRIAGFDRAIALASSALTAIIPLTIVITVLLPSKDATSAAESIIRRYELSGDGADAVREAFAPSATGSTSLGVIGFLFVLIAVLSFTRAVQRLFEQTWDLPALSVRNTVNGVRWLGLLLVFTTASGWVHQVVDRGLADVLVSFALAPLTAAFLIVSGWILSARRIAWRDLVPFGVVGSILLAGYQIGASIYVPHLFSTYAGRYGVIGAVFAMISALFAMMVVLVGSAAAGREVRVELDNIRDGIRPSDDEIRKQWDIVIAGAREKWSLARDRFDEVRERQRRDDVAAAAAPAAGGDGEGEVPAAVAGDPPAGPGPGA